MYCSECGAAAHGKFCSNCGKALKPATAAALVPIHGIIDAAAVQLMDWELSVNYEEIMRAPEVRARVSRAAEQSDKRISGEEFLRFCDKAFGDFYGGVSMEKLAAIVQPIYSSLGVNTGKEERRVYFRPPGIVIVSLLCSLARRGRPLRQVRQGVDGCLFEATLPSDLWTLAGDLFVEVRADATGTTVAARTVVKGQFFDWGKSKRCLDELLTDLTMTPAAA